ncbi:MAG TPA: hypothetical protein ENI42_00505 [Thermoplasmatales archaeon]|nr:hypothetical protein [Thermoplasmatales archaeon]
MVGGYGRGNRYRWWYRTTGLPGWMRQSYPPMWQPFMGYPPTWYPEPSAEEELRLLEEEKKMLEDELKEIERRIEEVKKEIKEVK